MGVERPWPFRRNIGLGGASWALMTRPSYRTDSRARGEGCCQSTNGLIGASFVDWPVPPAYYQQP